MCHGNITHAIPLQSESDRKRRAQDVNPGRGPARGSNLWHM